MSEAATQSTETTETTSMETTADQSLQTDAQSASAPEGTVTEDVSSKPSKDAEITKKEEPVSNEETQETTAPFKPNYDGMIQGFIDGDLTEEDYAAIEKSGLSREQFDLMAEGFKARQEANTQKVYEVAGGQEAYTQLQQFGAEHLSDDEIEAFNSAINSGNPNLTKMAILGLKAMYQEQHGSKPQMRIESDGSSSQAVEAFSTQAEVIKALNDRRYGRDQAYTKQVDERRARSPF